MLTRKEYAALADTSELREYERLQERVREAHEKLERAELDLEEFEESWKMEADLDRQLAKVMDRATRAHFEKWLDHSVHDEDRSQVTWNVIHALADTPDLMDRGYTWKEISSIGTTK